MKIFSGFLTFAVLALVLCFALSNRQSVAVGLWPLTSVMQMSLYVVGLVPLAAGLVVGGVLGWAGTLPHRIKARRLKRELDELHEKVAALQKAAHEASFAPVANKRFWEK